jgi:hypothetical protein
METTCSDPCIGAIRKPGLKRQAVGGRSAAKSPGNKEENPVSGAQFNDPICPRQLSYIILAALMKQRNHAFLRFLKK